MSDTADLYRDHVIPSYGRFEIELERGEGARVWDVDGREYLDFCSGIAVVSVGHCHPELAEVIARQARTLVHTSNLYLTRPQALLARRLSEIVGAPGKTFFCNSGAEANEALYKLARKFGNESRAPRSDGRPWEILTFAGSFHGRTLGGLAATAQEKIRRGFEPVIGGFRHLPFNDPAAVEAAITPDTVAILVEPIQGEGGVNVATPEFLRALRHLCDERALLLLLDEVQCGLGRAGAWNGWQAILPDGFLPDAVSWAKGLGGGLPIGAVWITQREFSRAGASPSKLADLFGPGTHGSTFGGNPLASSAALAVLDIIARDRLPENARGMGEYAASSLLAIGSPLIRSVRGRGLLIGIELDPARFPESPGSTPALQLIRALHQRGMLAPPAGPDVLRWLPPLNVTRHEIDQATAITADALASLAPADGTP